MTFLQVEPTTRCNLDCTYCTKKEPDRDLHPDTLEHLILKHKPYIVKIQGLGEPFLAKTILTLCKICKKHGCYVIITTNGTLLNYDALHYVDRLTFSIDILNKTTFNKTRNANLDKVLFNLHEVRTRYPKVKVGINQVVSHFTSTTDTQDLVEFCRTFGLTLHSNRIVNFNIEPNYMVRLERNVNGPYAKWKPRCLWGTKWFYYNANGESHPCCVRMNDVYIDRTDTCENCPD